MSPPTLAVAVVVLLTTTLVPPTLGQGYGAPVKGGKKHRTTTTTPSPYGPAEPPTSHQGVNPPDHLNTIHSTVASPAQDGGSFWWQSNSAFSGATAAQGPTPTNPTGGCAGAGGCGGVPSSPINIQGNPFLSGNRPQSPAGCGAAGCGGAPPPPVNVPGNPFLSGVRPQQPGFGGSTVICSGPGNFCVAKHLCSNGYINQNGQGIMQTRSGSSQCDIATQVCCKLPGAPTGGLGCGSSGCNGVSPPGLITGSNVPGYQPGLITGSNVPGNQPGLITGSNVPGNQPGLITGSNVPGNQPGLITGSNVHGNQPGLITGSQPTFSPGYAGSGRLPVYSGPRPGTGNVPIGGFQRPVTPAPQPVWTGPQNTTPHPGCAAALKCVPESYCSAEGVMMNSPVSLSREQQENRVPLSECMDPDSGIVGKCCRDPNYKDPWPGGMMMMPKQQPDECSPNGICLHAYQCADQNKLQPMRGCRVPLDGASGVCCAAGQPIFNGGQGTTPLPPVGLGGQKPAIPYRPSNVQQPPYQPGQTQYQPAFPQQPQGFPQSEQKPGYPQQPQTGFPQQPHPGYPQQPQPGPSQQPQPGPFQQPQPSLQPGYGQQPQPSQKPGFPQQPQPGIPQQPQPGQKPGFPQQSQPGYPQQPQPGQKPGFPQPGFPVQPQPGYPQQPQAGQKPGFSQPSPQPGFPQQPQPGQKPGFPQPGFPQPSPQPGFPVQPQPGYPQQPQPGQKPGFPQPSPQPGFPQPGPQPGFPQPSPQPGFPQQPQPGQKPGFTQQPQPGFPQKPQPGFPQQPQPGFPQKPQPGLPQQPQPGLPQQPQPGFPQQPQPGFPQQPQPGFPQQPQPGYPQQSQPGFPQQPKPGFPQQPSAPGYPQPGNTSPPKYPVPGQECGIRKQVAKDGLSDIDAGFGEFAWQAIVGTNNNRTNLCSGAIISDIAVVTSANCLENFESRDLSVKAGAWKLDSYDQPRPLQVVPVIALARHPNYDAGSRFNDLAVLLLSTPLKFDFHVDTICLPDSGQPSPSDSCVATGWEKKQLQNNIPNSIEHQIAVKLVSSEECQNKLRSTSLGNYFVLDRNFQCAIPTVPAHDLCKVSVGSPIACQSANGRHVLSGLYSWDVSCSNSPAVFAKPDVAWIKSILAKPVDEVAREELNEIQRKQQQESLDGVDTSKPGFDQGYGK